MSFQNIEHLEELWSITDEERFDLIHEYSYNELHTNEYYDIHNKYLCIRLDLIEIIIEINKILITLKE